MQFEKYVNRISYLDELIRKQGTGTPGGLAKRFGMSERMVYRYIDELRNQHGTVRFDRKRKTYYYVEET